MKKDCDNCKNNVEYPPPHICDICTSLDQEEEYEMWEPSEDYQREFLVHIQNYRDDPVKFIEQFYNIELLDFQKQMIRETLSLMDKSKMIYLLPGKDGYEFLMQQLDSDETLV